MRLLILTQCTAAKAALPCPAESMYKGQHHARLMRGVAAARTRGDEVDVYVISAMHGLVAGHETISPYDQTFTSLSAAHKRAAFRRLRITRGVAEVFEYPYDAALVALGEDYCGDIPFRDADYAFPTVRVVASPARGGGNYAEVPGGLAECRLYGCGIFSLKGEIARRALCKNLYADPGAFLGLAEDQSPLLEECEPCRAR